MRLQERCRRREYILRSSVLRQAKGPTIHEGNHSDGSVDVTDAIDCHCLLQIILRLPVRIGGGALLKIVLARKFSDLCIELSRRKPQNGCHYQSENNGGCFLRSSHLSLRALPVLYDIFNSSGSFATLSAISSDPIGLGVSGRIM